MLKLVEQRCSPLLREHSDADPNVVLLPLEYPPCEGGLRLHAAKSLMNDPQTEFGHAASRYCAWNEIAPGHVPQLYPFASMPYSLGKSAFSPRLVDHEEWA